MAYGLNVYDANGNLVVGYTDKLTRFIDYFEVGEGSSGSKSYPGLAGAVLWATGKSIDINWPHRLTFSGNTVYWEPYYPFAGQGPTGITVMAVG